MYNHLNLQEVDQEQALNLVRFFVKSHQNLFLFGRRGTGKTHISMQGVKNSGYKLLYINLSVIERSDLAGYPNIHQDGDVITFKSPEFLPLLKEGEKPNCVVLFDEVDKANSELYAPLLEILQFRKINGKPLNIAACILTGNLSNEGAYSSEVSSALLDRGAKYFLRFNFDKWLDWAKLNQIHDLITGFLSREPEMVCGSIENISYASPSPRGWTSASEALIKAKKFKMTDIETISSIVSGFVGSEAGSKFQMWYQYFKKFEPTIFSLLENGECNIKVQELTPSERFIFCITACYLSKQKILEDKNNLISLDYLCNFFNNNHIDLEIQLLALTNTFSFEFITKYKMYTSKVFFEKISKLQENVSIKNRELDFSKK